MSILNRKKADCSSHEWTSTVNSGLRRSVCRLCGMISLEAASLDLSVPESLQRVSIAIR